MYVCVCVCGGGHELESGCALQTNRSRAVQIKAAIPLDFPASEGPTFVLCAIHISVHRQAVVSVLPRQVPLRLELGGEQYPKQEVG